MTLCVIGVHELFTPVGRILSGRVAPAIGVTLEKTKQLGFAFSTEVFQVLKLPVLPEHTLSLPLPMLDGVQHTNDSVVGKTQDTAVGISSIKEALKVTAKEEALHSPSKRNPPPGMKVVFIPPAAKLFG